MSLHKTNEPKHMSQPQIAILLLIFLAKRAPPPPDSRLGRGRLSSPLPPSAASPGLCAGIAGPSFRGHANGRVGDRRLGASSDRRNVFELPTLSKPIRARERQCCRPSSCGRSSTLEARSVRAKGKNAPPWPANKTRKPRYNERRRRCRLQLVVRLATYVILAAQSTHVTGVNCRALSSIPSLANASRSSSIRAKYSFSNQ